MTATETLINGGSTVVTAGGTTAPAAGTVESWTVTAAAWLVASTGGPQVRVWDAAAPGEVMLITNYAAGVATVVRGAEDYAGVTTPTVAHAAGFTIVPALTKGALVGSFDGIGAAAAAQAAAIAAAATDATTKTNNAVAALLGYSQVVAAVAVSNQALTGLPTIDGYAMQSGDVLLCEGQTTQTQDGPWVVAAGAWTRPAWYATGAVITRLVVLVQNGTLYANTLWFLNLTNVASVTVDTTPAGGMFNQVGRIVTNTQLTLGQQLEAVYYAAQSAVDPTLNWYVGSSGHSGAEHVDMTFGEKGSDSSFRLEWAPAENIFIFSNHVSGNYTVTNYFDGNGILNLAFPLAHNPPMLVHTPGGLISGSITYFNLSKGTYKRSIAVLNGYKNAGAAADTVQFNQAGFGAGACSNYVVGAITSQPAGLGATFDGLHTLSVPNGMAAAVSGVIVIEGI